MLNKIDKIRKEFEEELGKPVNLSLFDTAVVFLVGGLTGAVVVGYTQIVITILNRLFGL